MSGEKLTITRTFNDSRERVFDAFTRKDAIQAWYGPEGFTVPSVAIDPKPGGKYRIEMHSPEGSVHVITGQFREVSRPEKLVFTWAWLDGAGVGPESLVTLTFKDKGGATEMTLVHSGFATVEARDAHNGGWTSSLECLTAMLAGKPQPVEARPTIIGDPRSSHVRSARMAFVEKGIAYALEPQPPQSDPVRAIHPFGKIPVFRAGKLQLFETSAIMRYVDEAFPGPRLMPETPADRARAEQWISCVHCYFYDSMVVRYVLQYIFPGRGRQARPGDHRCRAHRHGQALRHSRAAYNSRNFLVGDRPTIADLLIAPIVFYVQNMPEGKEVLAPFAAVRRAHSVIAERDSFKATLPPTK
jgi:glutathione S-transferase